MVRNGGKGINTQMNDKHIIWDWNGTLIDDVNAAVNALNRMLALRNVRPVTREYYRANFGFPVRPFYAQLGVDLEHEDWDRICIDFHRFIAEEKEQYLRHDAIAAMTKAKSAGIPQSILSALRQDLLLHNTAADGVAVFMEHIFGVDNLDGASKLSRGHELIPLIPAKRIYFIGDTLHDAEVARELGCECILVDGGHQTAERLRASGCTVTDNLVSAVEAVIGDET